MDPSDIRLMKIEIVNAYRAYPKLIENVKRMSDQQIISLHTRLKKDGKIK